MNLDGRFVEYQNAVNGYGPEDLCKLNEGTIDTYNTLPDSHNIRNSEDLCPVGYNRDVDIKSWGICSCWANGGRRSKGGTTTKCEAVFLDDSNSWQAGFIDKSNNQVCTKENCTHNKENDEAEELPKGI